MAWHSKGIYMYMNWYSVEGLLFHASYNQVKNDMWSVSWNRKYFNDISGFILHQISYHVIPILMTIYA